MRCAVTYDLFLYFFSFNDTATTDIYSLSLHDALPILSSFLSLSHAVFKKMNRKRTGANINIFMIDDFDNLKVVFKFLKRYNAEMGWVFFYFSIKNREKVIASKKMNYGSCCGGKIGRASCRQRVV